MLRRQSSFLVAASVLALSISAFSVCAEESADAKAGREYGSCMAQFIVELVKKNMAAIKETEAQRADARFESIEWLQAGCDSLASADMKALLASSGLDAQHRAIAYIMYFQMRFIFEQWLRMSRGEEAAVPELDHIYVEAAKAEYNDTSAEKVAELAQAFGAFSLEMKQLVMPEADEACAAA